MKTGKGEGNTKDGNGSSHRRSSEETAPDEKPFLPTDVEMELRETFQKGISRLGEICEESEDMEMVLPLR